MTAQQLKNSILQMAVQGKLVPQDPNDEPASVLLERIRAEKERLIKEKKIKREKNPSVIFKGADNTPYEKIGDEVRSLADEVPFDIPDSWEWVRLGNISSYAETKQKVNATSADPSIWGLDLEDIEKGGRLLEYKTVGERKAVGDKTVFTKGDILYSKLRPYLLKILVAPDDGICTPEIVPFRVYGGIDPSYIVNYLKSPYVDNLINSITYGVKMPRVGTETMTSLLVPIPPLEEQRRIVEKIDEVASAVSAYDVAYQKNEALNSTFPETLKKSILQEAVQGKLVPQDPSDEPAEALLEHIRAEKQRLVKEGEIKKDKYESVIFRRDNSHYEKLDGIERCIDDEIPFDIPDNWRWVRWGNISESIQYGYNAPAKDKGRIKMVRISDIQNNIVLWDTVPYCEIAESDIGTYLLQTNDILFARTGGTVGKSYLVQEVPEEAIYAGYLIRTRYSQWLCPQYLKFFMESELYWSQLRNGTIATAQPNCNGKALGKMLLPIPPLSEQYRIVEKVNALFDYCNSI
ncbi:restriction endonuclease subunit S [Flavonifractor plautii]|uniref:Restriction endonuclease subunit S n=1 Tax=Flavonifractor plautii TaxID=292800 RepID=A0AAW6CCD8_FLAPL|nr:restriction endonuclease subunit S [Flavonifractor plautii]MDB7926672.1 restriction endonuclease subunit S [Flavonifractor plautii]MDB7932623.1 restriction endonuclease subunit S [Flavonifractor plautii]MDB7936699.1 restriction endonuclease subunit S [Flavonifractor plautii]